MPTTYDINDPNLDFDLETQAITNALKQAQDQQNYPSPTPQSGIGGIADWALQTSLGARKERETLRQARELAAEQNRRFTQLQQQLNTPGTKRSRVLAKTLAADQEGPEQMVDQDVPLSPVEENQRRMDIATKMYALPKARGVGTMYLNQGAAFPERMAQQQERQAAAAELARERAMQQAQLQAERLEAQKQRDADARALRLTIAGMNRGGGSGDSDLDRQIKELRLQQLENSINKPPVLPVKAQDTQRSLQNLESGVNAYQQLLNDYDPQSIDALTDTKRAAISSAFTDLQMRLKEAYELGAITGPDMQVLQSAITDPTSLWGIARGAASGRKPFDAQISQTKAALNRTKRNFEQQYGVTLPEPRGTMTEPMPGTAPAKPYADPAKEQRYQEWLRSQGK